MQNLTTTFAALDFLCVCECVSGSARVEKEWEWGGGAGGGGGGGGERYHISDNLSQYWWVYTTMISSGLMMLKPMMVICDKGVIII